MEQEIQRLLGQLTESARSTAMAVQSLTEKTKKHHRDIHSTKALLTKQEETLNQLCILVRDGGPGTDSLVVSVRLLNMEVSELKDALEKLVIEGTQLRVNKIQVWSNVAVAVIGGLFLLLQAVLVYLK